MCSVAPSSWTMCSKNWNGTKIGNGSQECQICPSGEVVNNDDLPDGCEVSTRAFYVNSYIIFIFCNDPHTLADVVQEKTKEHIRRYNDQYCLEADDLERDSEILIPE